MAFFNPFCSQEALSHSNYCTLEKSNFTSQQPVKGRMKEATEQVASKLSDFVADLKKPRQLPGLNSRRNCNFGVYPQLGSTAATAGLCRDLASFLHDLKAGETRNSTFMAVFTTPAKISGAAFQAKVEEQINLLQEAAEPFYCTPESEEEARQQVAEQTITFGGKALKVTAIHRQNTQGQLKFDYPMLAFSLLQK